MRKLYCILSIMLCSISVMAQWNDDDVLLYPGTDGHLTKIIHGVQIEDSGVPFSLITMTNNFIAATNALQGEINNKVATNETHDVAIGGDVTIGLSSNVNTVFGTEISFLVAGLDAQVKESGFYSIDTKSGWAWAYGYRDYGLTRLTNGVLDYVWLFHGDSKDMDANGNSMTNISLLQSTSLKVSATGATVTNTSNDSTSTDAYTLLTANAGYIARTNAIGIYSNNVGALSYLRNLVEDTTPQLGGALDCNGKNIQLGSNWLSGDGENEGVCVDSSGNVGIGTNVPAYPLDVNGTIKLSGTSSINIIRSPNTIELYPQDGRSFTIASNSFLIRDGRELRFRDANTYIENTGTTGEMNIYSSSKTYFSGGNVGIGTNTPSATLHVNGTFKAGTGASISNIYNVSSTDSQGVMTAEATYIASTGAVGVASNNLVAMDGLKADTNHYGEIMASRFRGRITVLDEGDATPTWDATNVYATINVTQDVLFAIDNFESGVSYSLYMLNNDSKAVTWDTDIDWVADELAELKTNIITFISFDGVRAFATGKGY